VQDPQPAAYVELPCLGSLSRQHQIRNLSAHDVASVLLQGLSALGYLHGLQLILRDIVIDPRTIFVSHRGPRPGDLRIKLCWGHHLVKPSHPAPELIQAAGPERPPRTTSMNIWSLGIVVFWLKGNPLPEPTLRGYQQVVAELAALPNPDGIAQVLQKMMVIDPKGRSSAAECLELASGLLGQNQSASVAAPGPILAPLRNHHVSAGGGAAPPPPRLPPIAELLGPNMPAGTNNNARPSGAHGVGPAPPPLRLPPITQPLPNMLTPGNNNAMRSGSYGGGTVLPPPRSAGIAQPQTTGLSAAPRNNIRPAGAHGGGTVLPPPRTAGIAQPQTPGLSAGPRNNVRPSGAHGGGAAQPQNPGVSASGGRNSSGSNAGPSAAPANQSFISRPVLNRYHGPTTFRRLYRSATATTPVAVYVLRPSPGESRINISQLLKETVGLSQVRFTSVLAGIADEDKEKLMPKVADAGCMVCGTFVNFERALRLVEDLELGQGVREIVLAARRACSERRRE